MTTRRAEDLADELHEFLSEGRSELARERLARNERITLKDEEMWAKPAAKHWMEQRQAKAYAQDDRISDQDTTWAFVEAWDRSFKGGRLIREWSENHGTKTNMWARAGEPARYETPDGSIVFGDPVARDSGDLERQLRRMIGVGGVAEVEWDIKNPELELILPDCGSRLTAFKYIGKDIFVTIRRPTMNRVSLDHLVENGTMSALAASFLGALPKADQRVLVSGAMNTGKTVLLRAICAAQPNNWQLFTIESQAELLLDKFPDFYPRSVYAMEARKKNAQGGGEITMSSLIERVQRASPDLVVVGEIRGAAESAAYLRGINQGYPIIGSIHANGGLDSLSNLALYYSEGTGSSYGDSLMRAGRAIDVTVHMRQQNDGRRVLNSISLVEGTMIGGNLTAEELWTPQANGPTRMQKDWAVVPTGIMNQLLEAGFDPNLSDAVGART